MEGNRTLDEILLQLWCLDRESGDEGVFVLLEVFTNVWLGDMPWAVLMYGSSTFLSNIKLSSLNRLSSSTGIILWNDGDQVSPVECNSFQPACAVSVKEKKENTNTKKVPLRGLVLYTHTHIYKVPAEHKGSEPGPISNLLPKPLV